MERIKNEHLRLREMSFATSRRVRQRIPAESRRINLEENPLGSLRPRLGGDGGGIGADQVVELVEAVAIERRDQRPP